jgi:hypothetical protein
MDPSSRSALRIGGEDGVPEGASSRWIRLKRLQSEQGCFPSKVFRSAAGAASFFKKPIVILAQAKVWAPSRVPPEEPKRESARIRAIRDAFSLSRFMIPSAYH